MEKFRRKYRIQSNRAQFWDYSSPANYFITICIEDRKCILGNIVNGKIVLSEFGKIVELEIKKISEYHKRIILDIWTVMPNHIHLIISLDDYDFDNGISSVGDIDHNVGDIDHNGDKTIVEKIHEFSLRNPNDQQHQNKPTTDEIKQYRKQRRKMLIPKILGKFQQQTSKQINILRNTPGMKNWQPNYHDHIIRNNGEYERIKNYIINNPQKWTNDKFNQNNNGRENS